MGGKSRKDYEAVAPHHSFVHVDDFTSIEDLAKYLKKIDSDDTEYNKLHAWRSTHHVMGQGESNAVSYCELCQNLHGAAPKPKPAGLVKDAEKWLFEDTC